MTKEAISKKRRLKERRMTTRDTQDKTTLNRAPKDLKALFNNEKTKRFSTI